VTKNESIVDFKADRATIQKGAVRSVLYHLLFKLKGFITIPIITYYITPKEMGIYNLIMVTSSLLLPLFYLNLGDGPVVYLAQEKSKKRIREMYNTVVTSSSILFFLFSLIFLFVIYKFGGERKYLYYVIPVLFSLMLFKLFQNIYVIFLKTKMAVNSKFISEVIVTILTISLLIIGLNWKGMIYAVIIANILIGVYIYLLAKHEFPLRFYINKEILLKFLKISLPLLPVFFFTWIILSSDSYFLLYFNGEKDVGKYAAIYGLSNIILILRLTLNFFWFPLSSKLWVENREAYNRVFGIMFTTISIGLLLAVILFELNSKVILQILARNVEYRDAYVIMGTIAFSFGLMVLITLLTGPLYSNKNTTAILISYLIGALLNCALNFLLIPRFGIWGAAISTMASYSLLILLMSYFNYNIAKFFFFDKRLIFVLILFFPIWYLVTVFRENVNVIQLILVNVGLILFLGSLIYFKVINKKEKEYFLSMFKEMKWKPNSQR
jgi:O-antigen/teichoic acid export membrane protein